MNLNYKMECGPCAISSYHVKSHKQQQEREGKSERQTCNSMREWENVHTMSEQKIREGSSDRVGGEKMGCKGKYMFVGDALRWNDCAPSFKDLLREHKRLFVYRDCQYKSNLKPCYPVLLPLSGSSLSQGEPADGYTVLARQGKNGAGGVVVARWVIVARVISKSSPPAPQSNG